MGGAHVLVSPRPHVAGRNTQDTWHATCVCARGYRRAQVLLAHGSAMKDTENADAFVIGRDEKNYLQHGYGRHKCLGQYVSPVILVESLISILALDNLRRPEPHAGEGAFPHERRFGRLQLDDSNLYAQTFTLQFDRGGTTDQYFG